MRLLLNFIIAIAIGGLVGLEREIYQQSYQKKERGFAGIRTYIVVALLGAVGAYLLQQSQWQGLFYVTFAGLLALLTASYYVSAQRGYMGMTTELSVIMVYVLSAAAMFEDYQKIAVIFAVLLAVLLSMKEMLHGFAKRTKKFEWRDTLKFVFMAFVVLPLLPNQDFTVFGIENAFNPFDTWLMVVFVSGVSFVGYFLTKVVGGSHGIGLSGVLGGLVSSTAVTESAAIDSKRNKKVLNAYVFAAGAASIIKLFRVLLEAWVVDRSIWTLGAVPILAMAVVGIIIIARWVNAAESQRKDSIQVGTPLAIKPALIFGALYSFVVFFTQLMNSMGIDSTGMIIVGAVSGIADVDAVTLSVANAFSNGTISAQIAWTAIFAAVSTNLVFKIILAKVFGSKEFFVRVGLTLFLMLVVGLGAIFVIGL